jgi:radical SAM protein with 4Fe4S-binding SPASM domain
LKSNPCQAVINQLGILPDGTVLACPWALNEKGEPLHEIFVLGKVPEDKIETIIKSEKAKEWIKRAITKPPCRTLAFIENHTNGTTAQEAADSEDSYGKRNKVYCSSTTN